MKKFTTVVTILLLILAIYWSFQASTPSYSPDNELTASSFSTTNALKHVKEISKEPHAVGFPAHAGARAYIISELEKLGLKTSLQEGYTAGDWSNFSKAVNILARIKGSGDGKALLLLSHYDSSPHSSLGASDAGSGVAAILEGLRAFLSEKAVPKNDIIILISDAEELGLNGADLFVNRHPWAAEVGLVLNFEARGSGGPSSMFMETNQGNGQLIKEFIAADTKYPMANSLAYSIYKMLPNDTDLTVFREDRDIQGFNFAFIDDHYDYHTALDTHDRLDPTSQAHQGSYLLPLLHHFSNLDLEQLNSTNDYCYFNVPFFRMVAYPFEWIWPMICLATLLFLLLLAFGLKNSTLQWKEMAKGFLPLFGSLLINAIIGYYGWSVLTWWYPQYQDILHGFPYNGYSYIAAFVLLSIGICFWMYHKYQKVSVANLLPAPIVVWLAICVLVAVYLKGASFFIIPVFALLTSFLTVMLQKKSNLYVLLFLSLPALWIYAPLIKLFPVALGLKMLITASLLTSLTFLLLLPIFGTYKIKNRISYLCFLLFLGFMISAHWNASFSRENPKPSSLVYLLDADRQTANWASYEQVLSNWTAQYLGADKKVPDGTASQTLSSKYSTGFTYVSEAPLKEVKPPLIEIIRDTVQGEERMLEFCILPQRNVNRLEIFTNEVKIKHASINEVLLSAYYLNHRRDAKLLTHYITENEYSLLQLTIAKEDSLEITLYEASNDLLNNTLFSVPKRPEELIPMPFVLNDAVVVVKTLQF